LGSKYGIEEIVSIDIGSVLEAALRAGDEKSSLAVDDAEDTEVEDPTNRCRSKEITDFPAFPAFL